jgi:CBS domain-containing protein
MRVSDIMVRDVKSVSNLTPVTKALSLMQREGFKELPVLSGSRVVGLITLRSILTYPKYSKTLKVSKLMIKPPLLSESDDLPTVLKLMKESGVQGVPVVRGKELVGIVTDFDVLKALKNEFKGLSVNDFMRETPPLLRETDNIASAKKLLHYEKTRVLPVVDLKNRLVGVFYEEHLLDFYKPHESMGYSFGGAGDSVKLLKVSVKEVLKPYYTARIGEKITRVIDLMLKNGLTSIIIVDNKNTPLGCLERFELIKHLHEKRKKPGTYLEFSGLELDYTTNSLLTKVVTDHLSRINYLVSEIAGIKVRIKPLHAGSGVRKFELELKVILTTGVTHRVKKAGYALRECLDEALSDTEKIMKKNYKKSNP